MSGGVGRGRGWLKSALKSVSEGNPSSPVNHSSAADLNAPDNIIFSDAPNDYTDLISKIMQLNVNDDGIKLNQKIRYIIESWNEDCQDASDVEDSFDAIHHACLSDPDMATKLVLLIASRTFLSQEIHEQNIRLMFLRKLQDNFEGCSVLRSSDANFFRNSVKLMGEFFNKARLANGKPFAFMATPLLSYLDMLLDSADPMDFRLFTIQLHLNGMALREQGKEKLAEIMGKVRLMLCSNEKYSRECKLWLLLALDVANNRYALLPADIRTFYQEQLGDHAMACFQGSHHTLTVQTVDSSKNLESFESKVNVLQVSTESTTDSAPSLNVSETGSSVNCNSSGFQSDTSQSSVVSKKESQPSTNNKGEKTGRPILGVGARLQRNRIQNNESSEKWETEKSQSESNAWNQNKNQNDTDSANRHQNRNQKDSTNDGNWRDKGNKKGNNDQQGNQKKDWDKKKTPPNKGKKGWQHDDRFEANYS